MVGRPVGARSKVPPSEILEVREGGEVSGTKWTRGPFLDEREDGRGTGAPSVVSLAVGTGRD